MTDLMAGGQCGCQVNKMLLICLPLFGCGANVSPLDIKVWNHFNSDKRLLWFEGRFASEIARPYWERH